MRQGDYAEAKSQLGLAHNVFAEMQDTHGMALVELAQAFVESELSNYVLARQLVDGAIPRLDNMHGAIDQAEGLLLKARLHYDYAEDDKARELARQALHLESTANNVSAITLAWLALLEEASGDLDAALQRCDEALNRCKETRIQWDEALAFYTRSQIHRKRNAFAEARDDALCALRLFRHYGDRKMRAHAHTLLSFISSDEGNPSDAFAQLQVSQQLLRDLKDSWELVRVLEFTAETQDVLGDMAGSRSNRMEAWTLAKSIQHPMTQTIEDHLKSLGDQ